MSYEDYENSYNENLNRIRSFLAGTRSRSTLMECERLLHESQNHVNAMQSISENENNVLRINECKMRTEREIQPLTREIKRSLTELMNVGNRDELFYNAPNNNNPQQDMESLISSSDYMLRDSLALCNDSERIGNATLEQMNRQREQLETTSDHIQAVRAAGARAGVILRDMSRRGFRNKMVLKTVIIVLIMVNAYLVFHRILRLFGIK